MDENHAGFQENIAAYALGSLDPGEAAALEAHLETCETCRAELADYAPPQFWASGCSASAPAERRRQAQPAKAPCEGMHLAHVLNSTGHSAGSPWARRLPPWLA